MINKSEAINNIKCQLEEIIKCDYRKSNKGRPNALTISEFLDAFFLRSS
jgi:hypothetical protein